MPRETREEERMTEDESARKKLGPRGVPGGQDTAKMTPQQEKNIPGTGHFDGHTACVGRTSPPGNQSLPQLRQAAPCALFSRYSATTQAGGCTPSSH
jgi:hypothetical protein